MTPAALSVDGASGPLAWWRAGAAGVLIEARRRWYVFAVVAAIWALAITLIDGQSSIRQAAAYALRRIEPYWERSAAAARAIPRLQAALKSSEYWVRHSATDALKKLGVCHDRESSLATDSDGALRKRHAAQSILVSMLADADRGFRQAAAEALGRIGLAEALPHLAQRLVDTDRGVQRAAARSLEALRWQPASPLEKARQLAALERWPELITVGPEATEAITSVFAWNDAAARRRAIEALVAIGGVGAISALRGLAADPNPAIREEARRALSLLERPKQSDHEETPNYWGQTTSVP